MSKIYLLLNYNTLIYLKTTLHSLSCLLAICVCWLFVVGNDIAEDKEALGHTHHVVDQLVMSEKERTSSPWPLFM